MAIYRPSRPRWPVAAAATIVGGVVGLVIGLAMGGQTDPAVIAQEARTALISSAGTLEVVAIEYAEAVEDGEIVARPEYDGSVDALASSRSTYEEYAPAVEVLSPDLAAGIEAGFEEIADLMAASAPEEEVARRLDELADLMMP